tara:strand:- start:414 stop:800 length:387 start_codon:yes stop_codon:yes gene_type:complete
MSSTINHDKYPWNRKGNLRIDTPFENGEQILKCPVCDFEFTHIENVSTFARTEDEDTHMETRVDLNTSETTTKKVNGHGNNPSGRRNGLILHGHCEQGHVFDVEIFQHKGQTYFECIHKRTMNLDEEV